MPEHVQPADLPADLDRAAQVFGNRVRIAVLLALGEHGPATATDLAGRLNVGRSLVQHHTADLERLGILDVDPARTELDVRRRFFRINQVGLRRVITALQKLDHG